MRNINTMGKMEYVAYNFVWVLLFTTMYRFVLFSPVFGLSPQLSVGIFYLMDILGVIFGILITVKHRRNYVSMMTNQFFPLGIYCLLSFGGLIPGRIGIYIAIALGLALVYSGLMVAAYHFSKPLIPLKKCVEACLLGSRTLATLVLTVLIFSLGNTMLKGESFVELPAQMVVPPSEEGITAETCIDTVLLLQEEYWSELDVSQRLGVLQTIANIETKHLGIPEVRVIVEPISETTWGQYRHSDKTVIVDSGRIASEDGIDLCEVVCHEARHAYQFYQVNLYDQLAPQYQNLRLFNDAAQFSYEYKNYQSAREDYTAYYNQLCERDSRYYAMLQVDAYLKCIDNHLAEQDSG